MKSQRIFVLAILVAGVFVSFSADVRADTIGFDLIARASPIRPLVMCGACRCRHSMASRLHNK